MWIVYIEAGVALALAIFIVWWTLPRKKDSDGKENRGRSPISSKSSEKE